MIFKKINDDTIQCVVSGDGIQIYKLTISDIFTRSKKGETFLHDMIKMAHDEVGFTIDNSNIAMQITPLKDNGLIVTFTDDDMGDLAQVLAGIRDALESGEGDAEDILKMLKEAGEGSETGSAAGAAYGIGEEGHFPFYVMIFDSIGNAISFCSMLTDVRGVKSALYKYEGKYYLLTEKKRRSWVDYYTLVSMAMDFGSVMHGEEKDFSYIPEKGECLIKSNALGRLKASV